MSLKLPLLTLSAAFVLSQAAFAQGLNLKPGLWEVTSQREGGAAPQIPAEKKAAMERAMERMPPEQRARMEATMKGAGGGSTVTKSCIVADDLKKPMYDPERAGSTCTRTIISSTSTTQEVKVDCESNGRKTSGVFKMVATSPESWNSTLDVTMAETNATMKTKMSGKWMSSDCGSVKPASQK